MCYSARSSITSFIIGISACIYLLKYGDKYDKHIGFYLIPVLTIQLIEYFMWIDQKCGRLNHYATKSINLVLSSQIYFIILGFYIFNTSTIPNIPIKFKKYLIYTLIPITFIYLYIGLKPYYINDERLCSKPDKNGSLLWDKWLGGRLNYKIDTIFYHGIYILGFLMFSHKWKGKLMVGIGLIYFLLSTELWGKNYYSRFCFISVGIPVLYIILHLLHQ